MSTPEEAPPTSTVNVLRIMAMGISIALIIGGLTLLGVDLYRGLIEHTEIAQSNLEQAIKDTQRQTYVYASMLAKNPIIQRGCHFRHTGSLLKQIVPTLKQSQVDRITIHDKNGLILAQAHDPDRLNIQDSFAPIEKARSGTTLTTIYSRDDSWHLETVHPIFHQMEHDLIVGTVSVGYLLKDHFAHTLSTQVAHPVLFAHQNSIIGSSFNEDQPTQWDPSTKKFRHSEYNYDVVGFPLVSDLGKTIQAVVLVDTLSKRLTLFWVALSIPALVFVLFRERSRAVHKEKYNAKNRSLIQEREAASILQSEVTRRRQAQIELENALEKVTEASRLKSEFLATVSHELRTPLNAIMNIPKGLLNDYSELDSWGCQRCGAIFQDPSGQLNPTQEQSCPDCEGTLTFSNRITCNGDFGEHKTFLERIARSGEHLLQLIDDVLDMSRLEAGAAKIKVTTFPLYKLSSELSELTSRLAQQKDIHIVYPDPSLQEPIQADYVKLLQILVNLVGNAIKFTPVLGKISIDIIRQEDPSNFIFEVKDSGIGIPEENFKTIFESFRQVDGSATRAHPGTGLGLSISKGLVELHGGGISVQSSLGAGSIFRFNIPQSPTADSVH